MRTQETRILIALSFETVHCLSWMVLRSELASENLRVRQKETRKECVLVRMQASKQGRNPEVREREKAS